MNFFGLTFFDSMEYEPQLKNYDIFEEPTTYKNDYRVYGHVEKRSPKWPKNRTEKSPKPSVPYKPIDAETFVPLRDGAYVPFNLMWDKKPIIQTNPNDRFCVPV